MSIPRFYEKERKTRWALKKWSNGYRDYPENDVENIKEDSISNTYIGNFYWGHTKYYIWKSNIAGNAWEAKEV